jgi:ankyrin repeat protein
MNKEQENRLNTLYNIIANGDFEDVEGARDIVRKEDYPYLIIHYAKLTSWSEKRNLINLVQDDYQKGIESIMLDFLRAPYFGEIDDIELTKSIALGFLGEEYDQFITYYNDRELLRKDVAKVLTENGLILVESEVAPGAAADIENRFYDENLSPVQNLVNGAYNGEMFQAKEALRLGANVNVKVGSGNLEGMSALMVALCNKQFKIAKFLVEKGADVNYKRGSKKIPNPDKGQTAMWWAANHGNVEMMQHLWQKGAVINVPDDHGSTPLCVAASSGMPEAVKFLIQHGADVHAKIYDDRKAINLAANFGCSESVELLIKAGTDPDYSGSAGYTPLMVAAENGNQQLIKTLCTNGADVNAKHNGNGMYSAFKGMTPLVFAITAGFVNASKVLIEHGAEVNYRVPERVNYKNEVMPTMYVIEFAKGKRAESLRKLLIKNGAKH